jgi:outer membrane protein OmpA-like peptidoglycan-associated protein
MDYRYSFGDVALDNARKPTLVICNDACTAVHPLTPAPRFPALSIRVSQTSVPSTAKETAQEATVDANDKTATSVDKSNGQPYRDTRITVLFGLDSATLSDAEKAKLSSFVKGLDAETRAGDLFVTGYTCDLGSKTHNDALAMKRAEAVEAYIRKAGVRAIWVTGMGKCCYATKDPGKRYLNRRVEVIIGKREATK